VVRLGFCRWRVDSLRVRGSSSVVRHRNSFDA
jgi:hypothetical protein